MASKIITISLSLLVIAIEVQTQFFDLFQGYQPFVPLHHTTKRPDLLIYPQENSQKRAKVDKVDISNDRQTNEEQTRSQPSYSHGRENSKHTAKRKHVTTSSLLNLNFFTTTAPIRRAIKNSSRRNFNTDDTNANDNLSTSQEQTNKRAYSSNFGDKRQSYDEILNNIAGNYQTTRATTTKRAHSTTRHNYVTPKPAHVTNKPYRATTKAVYATTRSYQTTNRPNNDMNPYYTTHTPGVRPANVDLSKPPITNKPPALAVYPRPTDSSVIRFPEDPDTSPELIPGPDEDKMSHVEKRRYIELAEKMCDKYKSLNVKKLEAIPLVPSPEPVRVNVSVCPPTNVPLVVGGKVVTIQEFPHMALLGWTKLQGGGYSWKCGGSLISDQYVLTASHCAHQNKDDTVVTGAPRVAQLGSSYLDDPGALVVKVLSIVRHPKYVLNRSYYDIALVKLVKPVTFSEVVKPACLGEPPGVGEPIIATGWGRTEFGGSQSLELRSVSIPVWDMAKCQQALGTSRKLPNGPSADSQICAGEKRGGKDTCQGDSGGPAQIQDGCAWRVVAVTSVGRSCGAPNTPALYATIHRAFIAAQVFGKYSNDQNTGSNNRQEHGNNNRNNGNFNRPNVNNGNISNINKEDVNYNQNTNIQGNSNVNNNGNVNYNNNNNNNNNDRHDYGNDNINRNTNRNNNRQDVNINNYNNGANNNGNANYKPNNNRQDYFNENNNRNANRPNDGENINVNSYNAANVGYNSNNRDYNVPENVYNLNINNYRRDNVNYNNENDHTPDFTVDNDRRKNGNVNYDVVQGNYGNVSPDTDSRNQFVRDIGNDGYSSGFNGDYGSHGYVTEAPKYNDGRNWWPPY